MRKLVLDTETTGLSPTDGDRIVEIAAVELIDDKLTDNKYQVYINPEFPISEKAFETHGLSNDFLKTKPLFKDIVDGFLEFIGDDELIIHNAAFDMKFLNHELSLLGKKEIPFERAIDTLVMARKKYPGKSNTLDSLCDRLGVDRKKRTLHGALTDVELLADVYLLLTKEDMTDFINKKQTYTISTVGYNKELKQSRNFVIPEKDLENHQEFLKKLKNPMWNN